MGKRAILWSYWAVMVIGFVASFGIFTATIQNMIGVSWIPLNFGIGCSGFVMAKLGIRDNREHGALFVMKEIALSLGAGLLFGWAHYFSPLVLGEFVFPVTYICWLLLFVAILQVAYQIHREFQ